MSEQNNAMNMNPETPKDDLDSLFGRSIPQQIDLGDMPGTQPTQQVAPAQQFPPVSAPQQGSIAPQQPVASAPAAQGNLQPAAAQPTVVGSPDTQAEPAVQPQAQPTMQTVQPAVQSQAQPIMQTVQPAVQPQAQPDMQTVQPAASDATLPPQEGPMDLFAAVVDESVVANASALLSKLANKPPMFEYGAIRDEITDPKMTFEQLRNKMSADMPELEVRSHVSWTVSYNGSVERITTPDKTTIFEVKSKIEKSKKFMDALKKHKSGDKEPDCIVKPTITAQKKGVLSFPNYKGMYESTAAAEMGDKPIAYIPAQDGRVYEMRRNEIGTFIVHSKHISGLEEIRAGFSMSLPRVPCEMLRQIISFFDFVCKKSPEGLEALVNVYWDRQECCYFLHVPHQKITHIEVETDLDIIQPAPDRYLHVMDVHSHNHMPAHFSNIDDRDEQATRLYMVIGKLDQYYPEMRCRFACGGRHVEIPVEQIFEKDQAIFNYLWLNAICWE